jgi:hypothetical protein
MGESLMREIMMQILGHSEGETVASIYMTNTPNTIQVAFYMDLDGRFIANNLFFRNETSYSAASADSLIDALHFWHNTEVIVHLSWKLTKLITIGLALDPVFSFVVDSFPAPHINGMGGDPLPGNCNVRLEFPTSLDGRAYRGCNYICGIPANMVAINTIDADFVTKLVEAYNRLPSVVGPFGWEWVIVSTSEAGVVRPTGIATPVTSAYAKDNYIDSYKRRLKGRRFN